MTAINCMMVYTVSDKCEIQLSCIYIRLVIYSFSLHYSSYFYILFVFYCILMQYT